MRRKVSSANFVDVFDLMVATTFQSCYFDDSDDDGGDLNERTVSNVSQYRQLRQMLDSNWNEMT